MNWIRKRLRRIEMWLLFERASVREGSEKGVFRDFVEDTKKRPGMSFWFRIHHLRCDVIRLTIANSDVGASGYFCREHQKAD